MSTNTNRYSPLFAISSRILGQQTSRPLPSAGTDPNFIQSHPYNAQLARCLSEGLSLQESTEIIQLTNHPPTLFNLSHLLEGYVPRFSLPKLPPHFAKCGGNQQNENLPYFLLFHFHAEEEAGRCAEEVSLRREDSAMTNPNISAEAKPSLRSR